MVSILEEKGLLTKEGTSQTLYRGVLKLTTEGSLVAAQISKRAELAVEQAGSGLTEENRTIFYDSLETITANLRRISEKGLD